MNWFTQQGSIFDMGHPFPVLDKNGQSFIPALYMAGDVTSTPNINAVINGGAAVAPDLLAQEVDCRPPCDAHVIIIAGVPAGVSAALEFEKRGQEQWGGQPGSDLPRRLLT